MAGSLRAAFFAISFFATIFLTAFLITAFFTAFLIAFLTAAFFSAGLLRTAFLIAAFLAAFLIAFLTAVFFTAFLIAALASTYTAIAAGLPMVGTPFGNVVPFFRSEITDGEWFPSDVTFFRRMQRAGFPVLCDERIELGHPRLAPRVRP